jgi:hypothetical protein
MSELESIAECLGRWKPEQRRRLFEQLRREFNIHPLEKEWNVQAEIILEAISRASDLTQRGIRGVIAEAAFEVEVIDKLTRARKVPLAGDLPYDFMIEDDQGVLRIQVKMQRRKDKRPMMAREANRRLPDDMYVVETQRTRGGTDRTTGEDTRPYRFGEFDILAVSLHPSTADWSDYLYTVADWLLPREHDPAIMAKFQPVATTPGETWTNDLEECIRWLRSGVKRIIWEES